MRQPHQTILLWVVLVAAALACRTVGEEQRAVAGKTAPPGDPCRGVAVVSSIETDNFVVVEPFAVTCALPRDCDASLRRLACAAGAHLAVKDTVSLVPRTSPTPSLICSMSNGFDGSIGRSCEIHDADPFEYYFEGRLIRLPMEHP